MEFAYFKAFYQLSEARCKFLYAFAVSESCPEGWNRHFSLISHLPLSMLRKMDIVKTIFDISPFSWPELLCAMIARAIIGFERQLSGKPIGIRTSIIICNSTYAFATFSGINREPTLVLRLIG